MANTDILNWSGVQTLWNKIKATFIGKDQIATTTGASDTRPISQRAVTEALAEVKTKLVDTEYVGPYRTGTVYSKGNVVTYDGSSWVVAVVSASSVPSEDNPDWQLMAKKGGQGDKGDSWDIDPEVVKLKEDIEDVVYMKDKLVFIKDITEDIKNLDETIPVRVAELERKIKPIYNVVGEIIDLSGSIQQMGSDIVLLKEKIEGDNGLEKRVTDVEIKTDTFATTEDINSIIQ